MVFSRFGCICVLTAGSIAAATPIQYFDVGSAPGEGDVIKHNVAVPSWASNNPFFAAATVSSGTLFASMENKASLAFTATIAATNNFADCSPSVNTTGQISGNASTPIELSYNCSRIGSSTMTLVITPAGGDAVTLQFVRTYGNALDAGTSINGTDVVLKGVTTAPYAFGASTVVRNAYVDRDTFYFRLHPGVLPPGATEVVESDSQPQPVSVVCARGVCSPKATGSIMTTYKVGQESLLVLNIEYGCQQENGKSQVDVTIGMIPNTPIKFSVLKYCLYETGFSISSGTGDAKDVVNDGLVNPRWSVSQNQSALEPFPQARFGHDVGTVSFTLRAEGTPVKFDNPIATITNSSSFGGLKPDDCVPEVTGAAATSGGIPEGGSQQLDIGFAACAQRWGSQGGYVVVVVSLKLEEYLTVEWTFTKFHGPRPGFNIISRSPVPGGATQNVIIDGTTSSAWSAQPSVPAITFSAGVISQDFDVVVEKPALPYIVARPITPTLSISGVCSPQIVGPLTAAGQVVGSTTQRLRVVYWCKEDRKQPVISFTISENLYIEESFAFSKVVHFLTGLRIGTTQFGADVFTDGVATPPYLFNGGRPQTFFNADKRVGHVVCNYRSDEAIVVGAFSIVQNVSDYCSPTIHGLAANGTTLPPGECGEYTIEFNCITTAGITEMSVQAPLSLSSGSTEFGPVLYRFIKYSFANPPGRPDAPTLTSGSGSISGTVTVPTFHGAPVTAMNVSVASGSQQPSYHSFPVPKDHQVQGADFSFTISGLKNGQKYSVAVSAVNSAGGSPFSSPASASPSLPWFYIIAGGILGLLVVSVAIYCGVQSCRSSARKDSEVDNAALLAPGSEHSSVLASSGPQPGSRPMPVARSHANSADDDFNLLESDEEDNTAHAASDEEAGAQPRHVRQETEDSMASVQ